MKFHVSFMRFETFYRLLILKIRAGRRGDGTKMHSFNLVMKNCESAINESKTTIAIEY